MGAELSPMVSLRGIHRSYGDRVALRGVSIDLIAGRVVGLVGPNGAGKSTLLGIIAGFAQPTSGRGQVLGQPVGPDCRPCPFVGLVPEHPAFIEHLSGSRNMRLLASIRGEIGPTDIGRALESVGLDPSDRRPVRSYSQGMRQRLSLAQAIMERPRLMLLDEPTNGLDPHGVVLLREIVRESAQRGAAVVFASHLLSEVAAVSNRIVVIDHGRVVHDVDASAHRDSLERLYLSSVAGRP